MKILRNNCSSTSCIEKNNNKSIATCLCSWNKPLINKSQHNRYYYGKKSLWIRSFTQTVNHENFNDNFTKNNNNNNNTLSSDNFNNIDKHYNPSPISNNIVVPTPKEEQEEKQQQQQRKNVKYQIQEPSSFLITIRFKDRNKLQKYMQRKKTNFNNNHSRDSFKIHDKTKNHDNNDYNKINVRKKISHSFTANKKEAPFNISTLSKKRKISTYNLKPIYSNHSNHSNNNRLKKSSISGHKSTVLSFVSHTFTELLQSFHYRHSSDNYNDDYFNSNQNNYNNNNNLKNNNNNNFNSNNSVNDKNSESNHFKKKFIHENPIAAAVAECRTWIRYDPQHYRSLIKNIWKTTQVESSVLILGLVYLEEIMKVPIMTMTMIPYVYEHYCVCVVIASKLTEDRFIRNSEWAKIFQIPLDVFNLIEMNILRALDFELNRSLAQLNAFMFGLYTRSNALQKYPWTHYKAVIQECSKLSS